MRSSGATSIDDNAADGNLGKQLLKFTDGQYTGSESLDVELREEGFTSKISVFSNK